MTLVDHRALRIAPWLAATRVSGLGLSIGLRRRLVLAGVDVLGDLEGLTCHDLVNLVGLSTAEALELERLCATAAPADETPRNPDVCTDGHIQASVSPGAFSIEHVGIDCLDADGAVERFTSAGIRTVGDVLATPPEALEAIRGIGVMKATRISRGAARLAVLPREPLARLVTRHVNGVYHLPVLGVSILAALAGAVSVEDEIYSLVVGMRRTEDSVAVLRRWGMVEWPAPTLEAIADGRGISRERVRQIVTKRESLVKRSGLRLPLASILVRCLEDAGGILDTAMLLEQARAAGAPCEAGTLRVFEALGGLHLVESIHYQPAIGVWTTSSMRSMAASLSGSATSSS